jgi:hypothetical protein
MKPLPAKGSVAGACAIEIYFLKTLKNIWRLQKNNCIFAMQKK